MSLLKRAAEWPGSSSECHGVSLCLYSVCMMWMCQQCLTHGVHRQCSPPRVGAVVLVVLTSRLGWRRRARTPQSQLATQYRLVERQWDRQAQKHRERERGIVNHVTLWLKNQEGALFLTKKNGNISGKWRLYWNAPALYIFEACNILGLDMTKTDQHNGDLGWIKF